MERTSPSSQNGTNGLGWTCLVHENRENEKSQRGSCCSEGRPWNWTRLTSNQSPQDANPRQSEERGNSEIKVSVELCLARIAGSSSPWQPVRSPANTIWEGDSGEELSLCGQDANADHKPGLQRQWWNNEEAADWNLHLRPSSHVCRAGCFAATSLRARWTAGKCWFDS